jgi:hypothetical protein
MKWYQPVIKIVGKGNISIYLWWLSPYRNSRQVGTFVYDESHYANERVEIETEGEDNLLEPVVSMSKRNEFSWRQTNLNLKYRTLICIFYHVGAVGRAMWTMHPAPARKARSNQRQE